MTTSFFSGSCAIALTVLLSSFAAFHRPQHSGTPVAQLVQDTVPRKPAGDARRNAGSVPANQSATRQETQSSDTRGEGIDKGRKGLRKGAVDSTNHGAVNTPDTTEA